MVLDHHASNTGFGGINIVDPDAAATSVVADELLRRLGVPLDAEIAECLYVALATDTGSFRFDMTTPSVHEMAARLLATGHRARRDLPPGLRHPAVRRGPALRRRAAAARRLEPAAAGGRGLVVDLRHARRPGPARAAAVRAGAADRLGAVRGRGRRRLVVKQVGAAEWAVSMRSKGAVDVSRVAVALGGGGHRLAAGFTGRGTVDEVVDAIRARAGATLKTQG